jgi:urea transport system substrate-binding protein
MSRPSLSWFTSSPRYLAFSVLISMTVALVTVCGSAPAASDSSISAQAAQGQPVNAPQADPSSDTIKVGVLHSLSGTMSNSETAVRDATLLAIEEINAAGGVMGKRLEPVVEDGASDCLPSPKRPESCSRATKWR